MDIATNLRMIRYQLRPTTALSDSACIVLLGRVLGWQLTDVIICLRGNLAEVFTGTSDKERYLSGVSWWYMFKFVLCVLC